MRVGIIGGGIGGLCAAIGLQRHGAEVEVFERAPVLEPVGAGLREPAQDVFHHLILRQLRADGIAQD